MVVVVALSLSPQGYLHRKRDSLCYGGGDGGGGRSFLPLSPLSGGDGGGGRSFSLSIKLSLQEERFSVCGGDGGRGRSFSLSLRNATSPGREILCLWW